MAIRHDRNYLISYSVESFGPARYSVGVTIHHLATATECANDFGDACGSRSLAERAAIACARRLLDGHLASGSGRLDWPDHFRGDGEG